MKIGIDGRCFAGGRNSGVEEYARHVITNMVRLGRDHEFVFFFNAFSEAPDLSWLSEFDYVRIVQTRIPNKLLNLSLWYFRRPYLDKLLGGVDVFFAPNLTFLAVSRDCRLVATLHDLSFELYPETFSLKRRLWHVFVSPRTIFRRADRVIAVSRSSKDDLDRLYGIDEEKVAVIESGVAEHFAPTDRNDPNLLAVKARYDLPYRFILFMGTFEPRKNIAALIRAYSAFRKALPSDAGAPPLILAGLSGWREREIEREIEASPYREDIRRIGFVREEDKSALYSLATIFVYPSLYEGFGLPVVEAMRCGACVITSNTSSLGEVAGDGALYVDPLRSDELAVLLGEVFLDADLRREYSRRAILASARFSWNRSAKETLRVLEGCLAK